jgi:hypothetical protein
MTKIKLGVRVYIDLERVAEIADRVVPEYRTLGRSYSCTGTIAKRWGAAYRAAYLALGGDHG